MMYLAPAQLDLSMSCWFTNKIKKLSKVFTQLNVQELNHQFISNNLPQSQHKEQFDLQTLSISLKQIRTNDLEEKNVHVFIPGQEVSHNPLINFQSIKKKVHVIFLGYFHLIMIIKACFCMVGYVTQHFLWTFNRNRGKDVLSKKPLLFWKSVLLPAPSCSPHPPKKK